MCRQPLTVWCVFYVMPVGIHWDIYKTYSSLWKHLKADYWMKSGNNFMAESWLGWLKLPAKQQWQTPTHTCFNGSCYLPRFIQFSYMLTTNYIILQSRHVLGKWFPRGAALSPRWVGRPDRTWHHLQCSTQSNLGLVLQQPEIRPGPTAVHGPTNGPWVPKVQV